MNSLQYYELIFREARESDLALLVDLLRHLNGAQDLPPIEQLKETWIAIIRHEGLTNYVVEVDGQLVAGCHLVIVPNLTRGARPYGWIENVVTHPDYRRQGLGNQLLKYALEQAWEKGCYKVMLMTGSKRPEIHEFYEKAGFQGGVKTAFLAIPPSH